MRIAPLLIAFTLFVPIEALAVVKCVDAQGRVTFQDGECPTGSSDTQVNNVDPSNGGGLRPGEQAMLNQMRMQAYMDRYQKREQWEYEQRHHLSYEDRNRIQNLKAQRQDLQAKMGSEWGNNAAINNQIQGIDQQIQQIQSSAE